MSAFFASDLPPDTVSRARAGAVDAQESIYRAFQRPVRTLAQFDGRGSFAGWVRAITVRKCLMHLRAPWQRGLRWVEALTDDHLVTESMAGEHEGPAAALDLERALAQLGDTARVVVWLHDVEGYTHAEIGALLGGTASLSKSQLARAHARLRELLEPGGVTASCMPATTNS